MTTQLYIVMRRKREIFYCAVNIGVAKHGALELPTWKAYHILPYTRTFPHHFSFALLALFRSRQFYNYNSYFSHVLLLSDGKAYVDLPFMPRLLNVVYEADTPIHAHFLILETSSPVLLSSP